MIFSMINKYLLVITLCFSLLFTNNGFSQISYTGNGNSGFGGPIGGASMSIDDNGTTITFTFTKGVGGFNDSMVMYIANGENGRTLIDTNVNDTADPNRRAISNTNSANLSFPTGFEATHAIAINTGFGGLWEIPTTGSVGSNGLNFISGIGTPASAGAASFTFSFDWSQIGLTNLNKFDFVITYGNPNDGGSNMFSSNEAFGDGISVVNPGFNAMTYTSYKSYPNTWTGVTSTDFNIASNWSEGLPNGNHAVFIPNTTNQPISSTAITVKRVVINPGASLTAESSLTADVTLKSISNSYSSLIVDGSVTGTVNYMRQVNTAASPGISTTANDLISPPLSGMTFGSLRAANSNILSGTIDSGPTLYLFGPFDNSSVNDYVNYEETTDDAVSIVSGTGYRTGSTDGGSYTFTGSVEQGIINKGITIPASGSKWNLIGNPYPSYITLSEFLSINNGQFNTSSAGIYGYDGTASNGWTIWNLAFDLANPGTLITPGQGFFVASKELVGSVAFNPNMRTIGTTDDFVTTRSTSSVTTIKLEMTSATNNFNTDIYFTEFSTLGLDPGYDTSLFGGTAPAFSIYSHLVENNNGLPFAIQALGETDYENTTIALGTNANEGEQLTFSISESTLPNTVNVYLDDTVANTSTMLTSSNYILTPTSNLSGTGRFYLRFSSNALSISQNTLENLNIFTNQTEKTIVISGQLLSDTAANIYDIQGRLVKTAELKAFKTSHSININNLSTGVYVVTLSNDSQNKSEKIIIK